MSGHMEAANNPPAPGMHVSNKFYAIRHTHACVSLMAILGTPES